jgi:hypothetical protein
MIFLHTPATKTEYLKKLSNEPRQLVRGKIFHKLIQNEWVKTAKDGKPNPEKYIKKVDGKKGRVDILVAELGNDFVSIVEIKASDWDKMTEKNAKRNIKRQIRQIWSYIDSQLEVYKMEVCPGVIFPKMPKRTERQELVESMFNDEGIQVVWHE